jgi:O-antigen/teichoic acid export membrane protein
MSEHVEKSIGIVLKGSVLTLIGVIIGNVLWFASKIVITRATDPEIFGIYSLCYGIVSFAYMLSNLGLSVGIARYVAFFTGRSEKNKAHQASLISLKASSLLSIIFFVVAFAFSDFIADHYYRNIPNLSLLLKIIFTTIPFYALLDLAIAVARGHGDTVPKVYFLDFMRSGAFLLSLLFALPFGLSVTTIMYAYVISVILPSIASYFYLSKTYNVNFTAWESSGVSLKELLIFSLPLMFMPIMWLVLGTMDTLMLGYYRTAIEVGTYNASASLSKIFSMITTPVIFMFMPVATQFYAKKSFTEMSLLYEIFNKWIFSISIPVCMVLLFFPELIITNIFGKEYISGAPCLRIIVIGYLPSLLLGMNNVTLTASGLSMTQMFLSIFTIILNFVLNIVLIPKYGLNGAATATALSFTAFIILSSLVLYNHSKVKPFSLNLFKTLISAAIPLGVLFLLTKNFTQSIYHIPFFLIFYTFSYFLCLILFNGINKYDLIILDLVERKLNIHFTGLRRAINWIATFRGE